MHLFWQRARKCAPGQVEKFLANQATGDKEATNTGVMDGSCLICICFTLCQGLSSPPSLAADVCEHLSVSSELDADRVTQVFSPQGDAYLQTFCQTLICKANCILYNPAHVN